VWNGNSWTTIANTTGLIYGESLGQWEWGAVADGDAVYLLHLHAYDSYLVSEKYSYSTNSYGAEEIIWAYGSQPFTTPLIALDKQTGKVYAVWWDTYTNGPYTRYGHNPWAYYSVLSNDKWSPSKVFVNDSLTLGSTPVVSGYSGSIMKNLADGNLAMVYVNGTSYDGGIAMPVRFAVRQVGIT